MKFILTLLLCLVFIAPIFSQHASMTGSVTDTAARQNLGNAVISLLRTKDSILQKYVRSDAQGRFIMRNIPSGQFILLITFPKYADYVEQLTITDTSNFHFDKIPMILKAKLLEEVVIRQKISAIKMKGDTTEFTADSFHVQPNATVEELLKKLPGIQVDKNGKITAQGETVQKVLVDGEEFFGDDPTLVTQNLRADMVDKVQVFDKKSDQAAFTGIDDGQTTKTINLKLKDNKKNGYFGKIDGGIGNDGYYNEQLMFNYFRKKLKVSAYGIFSNTGKTGLNWSDRDKYGESFASNVDFDDASGYLTFNGTNDELDSWNGQYNGQGYPTVSTGGLHYNDKWGDDKQSANANYKYMHLDVNGVNTTNTQYILPDTLYYNYQAEKFNNQITRNRLNGSYEIQLDSTSSLKISANGGLDNKTTYSEFASAALASDSAVVNDGARRISTNGDTRSLASNILWKKKFQKKGRTISVNFNEVYETGSSDGYLYAKNQFYKGGIPFQSQTTDQYKKYNNDKLNFDSKITYSEPISAYSALVINYGVTLNNSHSDRSSYNKAPDESYSQLDSIYSNDYQFNQFTQRTGLAYNLTRKKIRFNAGTNIGFTSFNQTDMHADTSVKRNFVNWYPQAQFTYSFNQQKRIFIRYNGNTSQPTIQQIQPIVTNEDPLNIVIGNPTLKPQFSNNIGAGFSQYKVLTETNIYGNVNYRFVQNALVMRSLVDSSGKRYTQTVNLNGVRGFNAYLGYGLKWKKTKINTYFNGNINLNRNVSMVNEVMNVTKSGMYTLSVDNYLSKEKKYEFGLSASASYNTSVSSIQTAIKTDYWIFTIMPTAEVFLPLKFQVHTDLSANIRQQTAVFTANRNAVIWNAWVGKKFLKNDALMLKLAGNDLLNQNIGFNRQVNSNYISQNTYTTIQRYFMLSVVWNFSKGGLTPPKP